jgi:signal transduction histidine kinase
MGRAIIMQEVTQFKALKELKSEFVSTVSHDLRTPLLALRGYTEMLSKVGPLTDKQQLFSERISGGIDKMMALVDNLLDLSKIEADVALELNSVDLGALTRQVVSEFQEQAGRKQQQLIYHAPAHPALVNGDELRLAQVLANLLANAIKYTPERGQIALLIHVDKGQVLVKVEDNGLGIPAAALPFVFDKFFRVTQGDQLQTSGTGLGLALCKLIVEKHGGSIWAESEPKRGSLFAFTLPPVSSKSLESVTLPRSTTLLPSPTIAPTP